MTNHPPLSPRQRACIEALVAVHQEFGLFHTITTEALALLTGEPFPASLSVLVQYGLVARERSTLQSPVNGDTETAIGYRLTEAGWAEFAGVQA